MPADAQLLNNGLDVARPLGEDQAVSATGDRQHNIIDKLDGATQIGNQITVDRGNPARRRRVSATVVPVGRGVHVEHPLGTGQLAACVVKRSGLGGHDLMADRAELPPDQFVKLVAPVRSCGQTEPAPRRYLTHRHIKGRGGT
jgi:hypothetical protein